MANLCSVAAQRMESSFWGKILRQLSLSNVSTMASLDAGETDPKMAGY